MEEGAFGGWMQQVNRTFNSELSDSQRCVVFDQLISTSGATQLRYLSTKLECLLKRDFLRLLPLELSFYLLTWLDPQSLFTCCVVSKHWNKVVNECAVTWQNACRRLGLKINADDLQVQNGCHWKEAFVAAGNRRNQLASGRAFEFSTVYGHTARVYALYQKDGKIATGSDDQSVRLWDVESGRCLSVIQAHTCADVKFDENKLITASFDNTISCWDWTTGERTQHFIGHTGAVFSVDYSDELGLVVSGSADRTVKIWSLITGELYNTFHGHKEWVTEVLLRHCAIDSIVHSKGDYVLISMDRNEIKIWPISREVNTECLKTLTLANNLDRSQCFQPHLQFDGLYIGCASDNGIHIWSFQTLDLIRIIPCNEFISCALLGIGSVFAILLDQYHLCITETKTGKLVSKCQLPAYRRSKRGSSFLAGETAWLDGFSLEQEKGLVFATSMQDHSIYLVKWKDTG
ncbi:F-box/WD repeat-containing protein 2-like [Saccoglossus kowalevskii]|uniref:F-box/WD repeat-containing protein 2-like n=1 Tax=Saccoglossus kowalevskii TaxID=10224 RepID=A0ABM0H069_SACKO|nr:PREDICTED: F-box/WD repeat-containing protein 2-like [Saccoglossus kowalevskii]